MNWVEALSFSAVEGCAYVRLTNGMCSLVDEEEFERLCNYNFYPKPGYDGAMYAEAYRKHCGVKSLHRLVMDAVRGEEIDHRNRNGLDNRKCNLRRCTRSQNRHNSKKAWKDSRSKYKGVTWDAKSQNAKKPWRAFATIGGKINRLGRFATEREAAQAYNNFARDNFGEFARLNDI